MNFPTRIPSRPTSVRPAFLACAAAALALTSSLRAQTTYTVVDLSAAGSFDTAYAASGGQAAGFTSSSSLLNPTRAALWTGNGLTDLHPAILDNPATGAVGRSTVLGFAGDLQVGWGLGAPTGNRSVALAWRDTAASATILPVPFASNASQALATDGVQIVGFAGSLARDGTTAGPSHALIWNAQTGAVTDLGDGGNGARANGVGGGKQAGFITRSHGTNAVVWSGTSATEVNLHPSAAESSIAYATDGVRQVGVSVYSVRIRSEAANGRHSVLRNFATVWTGSAASAQIINPFPFEQSIATGVSGGFICGYGFDRTQIGTPGYYHALVWGPTLEAVDLNAFLPAGFTGSIAYSVDANGRVAGVAVAPDGRRHAVVWIPNP